MGKTNLTNKRIYIGAARPELLKMCKNYLYHTNQWGLNHKIKN